MQDEQQPQLEFPTKTVELQIIKGSAQMLTKNDLSFHDWAVIAAKADVLMRDICPDATPDWKDKAVRFTIHADGAVSREGGEDWTMNEWHAALWIADAIMRRNLYQVDAQAQQRQVQMARMQQKLILGHG